MQVDMSNRVVLVTGASEGIGEGIARMLASCGARVAIASRDEDDMQQVVDGIRSDGGRAIWCKADVTDYDQVKDAMAKTVKEFGKLDSLVANAGINGTWAPIDDLSPEDWRKTIDVNLTGTYHVLHHGVPELKKAGSGSIVIVSSINGTRTFSNEGASAYASSKAAQFALAKMMALELAPFHIRCNVICPGEIESAIHGKTERENLDEIGVPVEFPEGDIPLTGGKAGTPEQVARLTAFLISDLSDHITGTPVWIDGGQSLLV